MICSDVHSDIVDTHDNNGSLWTLMSMNADVATARVDEHQEKNEIDPISSCGDITF